MSSTTSSSTSHTTTTSTRTATSSTTSSTSRSSSTTSSTSSTSTTYSSSTSTSTSSSRTQSTSSSVTSSSLTVTASSTTTRSFTSSTTTSTLLDNVELPAGLVGTTAGEVLTQALQAAVMAVGQEQDVISTNIPAGNVTVVKLQSKSTNATSLLRVTRASNMSSMITISLPSTLLQNLSKGGNVLLVVTEMAPSVSKKLPSGMAGGKGIELNSPVLELSLAQESAGTVTVVPVQGLSDTIRFKLSALAPILGDDCAFLDPTAGVWSTSGTKLLTLEEVGALGLPSEDLAGSWCEVSHTSVFAVIQTIPFGSRQDAEEDGPDPSRYPIVLGITLTVLCCAMALVCFLVLRRIRPPSTGRATLVSKRGRTTLSFKCSELDTGKTASSSNASLGSLRSLRSPRTRKVLVQWEVPETILREMQDLNDFSGYRNVASDLATKPREVVRLDSGWEASRLSRQPSTVSQQLSLRMKSSQSLLDLDEDVPREREEDDGAFVHVDLDDVLPPVPDAQAYRDGEQVLYFSVSHQKVVPAFIAGPGVFLDEHPDTLPVYNCLVGRRQQQRLQVPLSSLRPCPARGSCVLAYVNGRWMPAKVEDYSSFCMGTCRVVLEKDDVLPTSPRRLQHVELHQIRHQFLQGHTIHVYRGRQEGWKLGIVSEDAVEADPVPSTLGSAVINISPRTVESLDNASAVSLTHATSIPVKIRLQEEDIVSPSFLLREEEMKRFTI